MRATFRLVDLVPGNGDSEVRDDFRGALRDLYDRIKTVRSKGTLSQQWLETMVWIEVRSFGGGTVDPIYFYDARDIAYKYGMIGEDMEVVTDSGEAPDDDILVIVAHWCSVVGNAEQYIKDLEKVV